MVAGVAMTTPPPADARPEEWLDRFGKDIDALVVKYDAVLGGDTWLDQVCHGLIELVKRDREKQDHDLVVACLESCEQHLLDAGFDHYASYK